MQVGIIADTHDNLEAVKEAVSRFQEHDVETIIHCGDVIAPPIIPFFEGFRLHVVLGNNDGEVAGLRSAIDNLTSGGICHGRFGVIELDGLRIAALHGERLDEVDACARSGAFDLVCHGHHHESRCEEIEGTQVVNPGGHFPTIPPEHRQIAILDTGSEAIEFHNLA